jgi:hypothetical protein
MLGADYRFPPSNLTLRFTRGCKVRALGGFLTVDVTPTLEAELAPELARLAREIDRQLPDVKREVEKAWLELTAPRPLPLLGCLVLEPSGIVQGPLSPSTDRLQARFALLARPELRGACPETGSPGPVPPLRSDAALPEEGTVHLGLVTSLSSFAGELQTASPFTTSEKRVRVAQAMAAARGSDLDLELRLAADVCGQVALHATPDFSGDGQFIGLTHANLAEADRERLLGAHLDPTAFAKMIQELPHVPPLLSVSGFRESAPTLASALSQRGVKVSAQVSSARAAGAAARDTDLVAWLRAQGRVTLELTELGR